MITECYSTYSWVLEVVICLTWLQLGNKKLKTKASSHLCTKVCLRLHLQGWIVFSFLPSSSSQCNFASSYFH